MYLHSSVLYCTVLRPAMQIMLMQASFADEQKEHSLHVVGKIDGCGNTVVSWASAHSRVSAHVTVLLLE